jgi:hypothetical protein
MSRAGLKAGLIGGAIVAVLQLAGFITSDCLGYFVCIFGWATYAGAGVLAAYWLPIPRSVGDGAGAGAIAGLVTGVIGGISNMIVSGLQFAITGGSAAILSQIPQESLDAIRDAGLDPAMFTGIGFVLSVGAFCCLVGMVIAVALGAIGGAVFAAVQSE